jgi:Type IV secretion-system coupling protein DNA-binding domain
MRNNHFNPHDVWLPIGTDEASGRDVGFVLFGQTGTGKSSALARMAVTAIQQGMGVSVIDPHGQLADEILLNVPSDRFDDVVHLDASDADHAVSIDWLGRSLPATQREAAASALVAALKGIWHDSWGPRLEMILASGLLALMEVPQASLFGLSRMLDDERYRAWVVKQVKNPAVRYFFNEQMGRWDRRQHAEFIGSVQNKLGRLFLSPTMRHLFGQVGSKVCLRRLLDERRILIANLSRGRIGEDNSAILGSMLVAMLEQAAMSRADIDESLRQPHLLIVDEAATFATTRFASALSQIRKYRLALVLAGQYVKQMSPAVADAIFGNVGTVMTLRTNTEDVKLFKKHFGDEERSTWWYADLPNFTAIIRRMHIVEEPWKLRLLAPTKPQRSDSLKLRRASRERFAVPRSDVEQRLNQWLGRAF